MYINKQHIIFRDLDDTIIIKNLKTKEMFVLEDVAADIWRCVTLHTHCEQNTIVDYIVSLYECKKNEIIDDIDTFIDDLIRNSLITPEVEYSEIALSHNIESAVDIEGDAIEIYQKKGLLYSVTIEMTYSCNEKCVHCYANYSTIDNPQINMTFEKYKNLLDDLFEMKVMHISFTGGDPFMYKNFDKVLEYTRLKGFSFDIYTNAQFLSQDINLVKKIADMYPQTMYISLYGSNALVHDSITNIKDSFNRTISVIKELVRFDISVILNIMVLNINIEDIPNTIKVAKDLNVEYRLGMSLIYKNDGNSTPMNYFVNDELLVKEIIRLEKNNMISIDKQLKIEEKRNDYMCNAAITTLSISPSGNIYPCISLKVCLGNIFNERIDYIWNSTKRKKIKESLKRKNFKECSACQYLDYCPHCIGISKAENKDMHLCNTCDRFIAKCIYDIENELG